MSIQTINGLGKKVVVLMGEKKEALMRDARMNRVCLLEDLDFYFDRSELREIKKMWKMELSIKYMSEYLNDRDPDEILLALIHLAKEDRIERRKEGLCGVPNGCGL